MSVMPSESKGEAMPRIQISVLDIVQETEMANDARQPLFKRKFL